MPNNAEARRTLPLLGAFLFALFFCLPAAAAVTLTSVDGKVYLRGSGSVLWNEVAVNRVVEPGEEIKTDPGARAVLTFDDGSRVEIGPRSSFQLENAAANDARMRMGVGWMKAMVSKVLNRRFSVRTPTAVCSVRGTEFDVNVRDDGRTSIDLFKGSLGVADGRGNEVLLKEGQRVDVDQGGVGRVGSIGGKADDGGPADSKERQALKREVGLEMTKEEVQAAAALEQKNAVYQQGKAMVDVNGYRVRIEEYIIRPAADTYKFVVLNERADRFDYFFRQGTFNKALPDDLSAALRQIPGCVGAPCDYWVTDYKTGYSNTRDSVVEQASGGHLVDLNNNAVAGDDVSFAFDAAKNDYVSLSAGTPFYTALYDNYSLKYNNVTHNSWVPAVAAYNAGGCAGGVGAACGGIQSMGDSNGVGDQRTVTNVTSVLRSPNCDTLDNCTGYRDSGLFHYIIYSKNGDGSVWDKYDTYVIDDAGKVAPFSAFSGATSGASYKSTLLKWNYQQIITASEFGGRRIDLVFEPKILIESGLIP